jgi:mannose-6-phosphate isomerase-like protein (cupin superfamily)
MHVSHLDAADAFVTLDGSTIRVGDDFRDVRAGECVVIPPGG